MTGKLIEMGGNYGIQTNVERLKQSKSQGNHPNTDYDTSKSQKMWNISIIWVA